MHARKILFPTPEYRNDNTVTENNDKKQCRVDRYFNDCPTFISFRERSVFDSVIGHQRRRINLSLDMINLIMIQYLNQSQISTLMNEKNKTVLSILSIFKIKKYCS